MKKILFVITSLNGGGAEKVLVELINNLDQNKFKIDVFLINEEGEYLDKVKEKCEVMSLYKKSNKNTKNILIRKIITIYRKFKTEVFLNSKYFSSKIIDEKYDVEVAFLEGDPTRLISRRNNKSKKIAWIHTNMDKFRSSSIKREKQIYDKFDEIITVSNDAYNIFTDIHPEHLEKCRVIYNPIDKNSIIKKSMLDCDMEKDNDTLKIIAVGRLAHVKGYDILLKAHKLLMDEGIKHKLIIIGQGPKKEDLIKYINDNKLSESVTILGFKENPYTYIRNSDIFIMPSRYEAYPMALCEAIVLQKPIIASNCSGISEILENGKYGMIVEVDDILGLKDSMKRMIIDKKLREEYEILANKKSDSFNLEYIISEVEDLLLNV